MTRKSMPLEEKNRIGITDNLVKQYYINIIIIITGIRLDYLLD